MLGWLQQLIVNYLRSQTAIWRGRSYRTDVLVNLVMELASEMDINSKEILASTSNSSSGNSD